MIKPHIKNFTKSKRLPLFFASFTCLCFAIIALEWNYIGSNIHFGYQILSIGYICGIIACSSIPHKKTSSITSNVFIYMLIIIISIILTNNQNDILQDIIKNTIWCLMFIMAYQWGSNNINFIPVVNITSYVILPILYGIYLYILSRTFFIGSVMGFRDAIIPIAAISPLVLFLNNTKVRNIHIFIIAFLCMLSAKRSVILGVLVGLIVFFSKNFKNSNNKMKIFLIFSFLLIFIFSLISLFEVKIHLFDIAFNRFDNMMEGDSNGRENITDEVLDSYYNSDWFARAFGHGSHSTISVIGKLTHNDVLQVLYDYGYIALITFVIFYIRLIIVAYKSFTEKRFSIKESSIFCYTISIFIFFGMFNCFISSAQTFAIVLFVCGYILGRYRYLKLT